MRIAHTIIRLSLVALTAGGLLTGCARYDKKPTAPTTTFYPAVPTRDVAKPKPRAVKISNERAVGTNPSEKAEVDVDKMVTMVNSGKFLGVSDGKICFQPKNLDPRAPVPALLEDAVIGTTIQGKVSADDAVPSGAFDIRSRGGVVRVKAANGEATTASAAKVAEYALSVPGVLEVQLVVPIAPKPRSEIAATGG